MWRLSWALIVAALLGCQLKPTRITQTAEIDQSILIRNIEQPILLDENTVVIDARSQFDYTVAHVPGSVRLSWEDFARPGEKLDGKPPKDLRALVKRLALLGISPAKKIVVVGNALNGHGEEGRVAWSLLHMGFNNVQVVGVEYFRSGLSNAEPPPRPNEREWSPVVRLGLEADREELLKIATAKIPEGGRPEGFIVDVRSRKEYFQKTGLGEGYVTPELRALHIPWEQFYRGDGRPNREMRTQLLSLGIQPGDRLITISNHGVRSGAAAFALMSIGFANVANFTGGYTEILTPKKGPKLRPVGK